MISCNDNKSQNNYQTENQIENQTEIFTDIATEVGLDFVHVNGMDGNLYYPEIMGPAVALFDFDNDDDLDVFIGQGGALNKNDKQDETTMGRLYRNELDKGQLGFTDVTSESGLTATGYSIGVATGDVNNDGFVDLFVTNFGPNQLFINQGNGVFQDMTQVSGITGDQFSSSAAFVDYNGDNLLDLYVVNYLEYSLGENKFCANEAGARDYCGPNSYPGAEDQLFKNLGNGIFENYSSKSGIDIAGNGLGVVSADFNADGKIDLYVTNDMAHNFMWMNQGEDKFVDEALLRGNAVNNHGKPEASMGVDTGDLDNDGDYDLFMTHLLNETNTTYINDGNGYFADETAALGMANPSFGHTGFGTAFLDYDNDGWLDVVIMNGAVRRIQKQVDLGLDFPLNQRNQLIRNNEGRFIEVSSQAPVLSIENVSRGAAVGDIDNDGDIDVLISNTNGNLQLLQNNMGQDNQWLGVKLIDETGKFLLGSVATLTLGNGKKMMRRSRTDASYVSANDPRIVYGLGKDSSVKKIEVKWFDGQVSSHDSLILNQYNEIIHNGKVR